MLEEIIFGVKDFIKIILVLFFITSLIGFFRTSLPEKKIREILDMKRGLKGNFIASLLGATVPFSSSAFDLFANLLDEGISLGIAFSFLITAPIINEYVVILMFLLFGWEITLVYLVSGIVIGTLVGWIISKFSMEDYVLRKVLHREILVEKKQKIKNRINRGLNEGLLVIRKLWFLILIGIIVKILIQVYVPGDAIDNLVTDIGLFGIPLAMLIGIPFPGSGAAVIPIAMGLTEKGIPFGIVFAYLVGLVAVSLPRVKDLSKILERKLIIIFFLTLVLATMLISLILIYLMA